MSRVKYLKSLERTIEAMQKATNDLTRENYELRQLLQNATTRPVKDTNTQTHSR